MQFQCTPLKGAYLIRLAKIEDARGCFVRTFCQRQFEQQGLVSQFVQSSMSFNRLQGTLRGMHFQLPPREETKLIQCVRGAAYDVLIDLRPQSPSFRQWMSVELSADDNSVLYVPAGLAHGFETLTDDTVLQYSISEFHEAELAQGVRWNDPVFNIRWPMPPRVISARDSSYPDWTGDSPPSSQSTASTSSPCLGALKTSAR